MIELLNILDGHLAKREWIALNKFTIADMALSTVIKRCLDFPTGRPALPALEKWQAKIDARPAFQVATGAKPSAHGGGVMSAEAGQRPRLTAPTVHPVTSVVRARARSPAFSAWSC